MGIGTHANRYMYRESKGDKWLWVPNISCLGTPIQVRLRVHVHRFRMETPLLLEGLFTNECHIYTSIAPSQALGLQGTSPGLFEGCCIWMELTMVEHNHGDPRQRQGDFRGGSQLCAPQIHQTSAVGKAGQRIIHPKISIPSTSDYWSFPLLRPKKFPQVVIFCKDGFSGIRMNQGVWGWEPKWLDSSWEHAPSVLSLGRTVAIDCYPHIREPLNLGNETLPQATFELLLVDFPCRNWWIFHTKWIYQVDFPSYPSHSLQLGERFTWLRGLPVNGISPMGNNSWDLTESDAMMDVPQQSHNHNVHNHHHEEREEERSIVCYASCFTYCICVMCKNTLDRFLDMNV